MNKAITVLKKCIFLLLVFFVSIPPFLQPAEAEDSNSGYDAGSTTVTATFDVLAASQVTSWNFEYNDRWFSESSSRYNHKLARLSLGLALSAFRPALNAEMRQKPSEHAVMFLDQCGFTEMREDDYDKNPSLYTVSTIMGHKTLQDEQGDFTLIAIGVCGQGYANEWLSNFTLGSGDEHLGFSSAAGAVYDRLFGYIAQRKLEDRRLKIWITGFSRAAAVSNILAHMVTDSTRFTTDTVYTYTFATPRTTKKPQRGSYPNIFNICGKMDPVPQIPFADWGFDRYGTTLYTPAQQTDSDYYVLAEKASDVFKAEAGMDLWNNVEWDFKLRILLNYVLDIAPDCETYTNHLQSRILSMYEHPQFSNILQQLTEMAADPELITPKNRDEANNLLTYIMFTLYGYETGAGIDSRYRNQNASSIGNLAQEHLPEVYLAWMCGVDDPDELFSDHLEYTRLLVNGNVDVLIMQWPQSNNPDDPFELVCAMDADGTRHYEADFWEEHVVHGKTSPDLFIERANDEYVIILPSDRSYIISLSANEAQTVTIQDVRLKAGYTNGDYSNLRYMDMEAGKQTLMISREDEGLRADGELTILDDDSFDYMDLTYGESSELAANLRTLSRINLNWRDIVLIVYSVPMFVLCLLIFIGACLVGIHRLKRRKKMNIEVNTARYDILPAACISGSLFLFMMQELLYWLMPSLSPVRSLLKLCIGILLVFMAMRGYRKQPSAVSRAIVIAVGICTLADIAINYSFTAALVLYGSAIILLCWHFARFDDPEIWQYILWLLLSALAVRYVFLYRPGLGNMLWPMTVYAVLVCALASMSLIMPKRIRIGAVLLLISNLMIFFGQVGRIPLLYHFVSLLVFYISMGFFASATRYKDFRAPHTPEQKPAS